MSENAPIGADHDRSAPWNQDNPEEKTVTVNISVEMRRTMEIKVREDTTMDELYTEVYNNVWMYKEKGWTITDLSFSKE